MKKLMCALAAVAAGSVFATDGIASANVVGYQQKEVTENAYTFIAPNFKAIGRDVTFADIGVNDKVTYGGTTLQLLTGTGSTQKIVDPTLGEVSATFAYIDATRAGLLGCAPGWYFADDMMGESCQNDRVIPFGSGLLVDSGDEGAAVVFNGQVANENTAVALAEYAYTFTGNCSPKDITFGDVMVNDKVTYGGTTIQLLTGTGATQKIVDPTLGEVSATFAYIDATRAGLLGCVPGWYFADDMMGESCQNDRVLKAGDGILVDSGDEDATVIIPKAL